MAVESPIINAGELRQKIEIQSFTTVLDTNNAESKTWATAATVWAKVEMLQGRELFLAQQVHTEIQAKIKIRYRTGITSAMRVKYGTRYFYIVSPPVDIQEAHTAILLYCKEVDPSGSE